jgi:hypothetical protein
MIQKCESEPFSYRGKTTSHKRKSTELVEWGGCAWRNDQNKIHYRLPKIFNNFFRLPGFCCIYPSVPLPILFFHDIAGRIKLIHQRNCSVQTATIYQ